MTLRDIETAQLLEESQRVRKQLSEAVSELDAYVAALQIYVDRLHKIDARPSPEEQR